MNMSKWLIFGVLMVPMVAGAAGIFNTGPIPAPAPRPAQPARAAAAAIPAQQSAPAQRASVPAYQPAVPPPASVIQPIKADPRVMAQFERYANESDEAYIARMKVVYQRSVSDMERASREHIERMKALAPK